MTGKIVMKRKIGDDGEWMDSPQYLIDGVEVTAERFAEVFPDGDGVEGLMFASHTNWPKSKHMLNNLGVLPGEVKSRMEYDRRMGVPTDYVPTADGYAAQPVYTSRTHRKKHCKAHGAIDRSGGYGDAT